MAQQGYASYHIMRKGGCENVGVNPVALQNGGAIEKLMLKQARVIPGTCQSLGYDRVVGYQKFPPVGADVVNDPKGQLWGK
eukprot:CAMPEP_0175819064 /NCGR_PEP_ID=MMETSP0107_2-20121207/7876_1 /TAXON_ID=195067 ORGANISM="Goniomonas pacifica, Strain CCMP1869" /NCGR_SAMPLE_ID=MMETSP0107_2 /ASSEMBLY_ACC=CAM_ASM_000203 /LENGTH=80 /DNA_ID=CAMNT_0017131299 /DNA_START=17 /DNA_END=259 /DNA_ORIENTATION=+